MLLLNLMYLHMPALRFLLEGLLPLIGDLLKVCNRPHEECSKHTCECCKKLPSHDRAASAEEEDEFHEFIGLVQIVLGLDQISFMRDLQCCVVVLQDLLRLFGRELLDLSFPGFILGQLQDSRESDVALVERNPLDLEDLMDGHVEEQVLGIEGHGLDCEVDVW